MASEALQSLAKRAEDLLATLRDAQSAPSAGQDSTLSRFRMLSQQLNALQQRGDDPLLQHLAVQPTALTGEPSQIPQLLSTRLDAEHEEQQAAALAAMLEAGAPPAPLCCAATHNQRVEEALDHFADRRAALPADEDAPAERRRPREADMGRAAALLAGLHTGEGMPRVGV